MKRNHHIQTVPQPNDFHWYRLHIIIICEVFNILGEHKRKRFQQIYTCPSSCIRISWRHLERFPGIHGNKSSDSLALLMKSSAVRRWYLPQSIKSYLNLCLLSNKIERICDSARNLGSARTYQVYIDVIVLDFFMALTFQKVVFLCTKSCS